MRTDLFQSYGHCWVYQIWWHIECSTLTASSFRIWNNSKLEFLHLCALSPTFLYSVLSAPISTGKILSWSVAPRADFEGGFGMDDAQDARACPGRGDLGLMCVGMVSLLRWVHLPVLVWAEAGGWGWGLKWQPLLLLTTQQWCLASVVSWPSSADFLSCWTPYCCPFRLSSQPPAVPFLGPCPNPTFQHPALLPTEDTWLRLGWARLQYRPCARFLLCPAFHRWSTVFFDPPKVPFCPRRFPHHEGIFWLQEPLLAFSFPPGLLVPFLILFFSFLFFYPTVRGFFLSF